jgi:hypothetical protein
MRVVRGRWLWLGLAVAVSSGCARVKPYQREIHAKKSMQDRGPVDKKLDEHVHEYREGSVGGRGVGGGGCGCN